MVLEIFVASAFGILAFLACMPLVTQLKLWLYHQELRIIHEQHQEFSRLIYQYDELGLFETADYLHVKKPAIYKMKLRALRCMSRPLQILTNVFSIWA